MEMIENIAMSTAAVLDQAAAEDLAGAVTRLAGRMDLKTLERLYILRTLDSVNGSRKMAVALLGISERTLRHKLRQYRTEAMN
jgi:two-component system response regulator FlrC